MGMTVNEQISLQDMLDVCHKKFGDLSYDTVVYTGGCDACSGGCEGHGASIWSTCDVK